jgi:hypothetical protein
MVTGSEEMSLIQLYVHTEVAHDTVAELAQLGDIQFKDVCSIILILFPLTKLSRSAQPRNECLSTLLRL